jgi:hypothetical protein
MPEVMMIFEARVPMVRMVMLFVMTFAVVSEVMLRLALVVAVPMVLVVGSGVTAHMPRRMILFVREVPLGMIALGVIPVRASTLGMIPLGR